MAEPRVRGAPRGRAQDRGGAGRRREDSGVQWAAGQAGAGGRWPGGERRVELGTRGAPS